MPGRTTTSASGADFTRLLDHVEPLAVLVGAAAQSVLELALDVERDLAGVADRMVVDLSHGNELRGRAGEKDLVREVELRASERALLDRVPEIARDLDRRGPGDAVEDRGRMAGRRDDAVAHDKDVLARSLGDEALRVEQDRLVVPRLHRLLL